MKRIIIGILSIISFVLFSCNKSSSGGGSSAQPAQEPSIVFSIDASNASISPGSTFNVNVTLTSTMPSSSGIKITTTLSDQTNNISITQNPPLTSTAAKNSITLINLPQQHWCSATITVSSVATPSNSASQTFTVVFK